MKARRLIDPSLWILIGTNTYLIIHYYQHPEIFKTLLWIYWAQSVLLGIFTFFDMLTIRNVKTEKPASLSGVIQKPSAWFFLFHYGFFHIVYLVFVAAMKGAGTLQWDFFKYFVFAFFVGQVITFIQHKIQQRTVKPDLGAMFFTPYLRIIPMHLTLILPSFFHISNMGLFLILKGLTDVIMYLVTRSGSSRDTRATMLASQQMNNI